jgi:hypothetical protein
MTSLWQVLRGRWTDPAIAKATLRGAGLAFVAAGIVAGGSALVEIAADGRNALQPRSLFFMIQNAASPPLAALLMAVNAALIEEIAYRQFGVSWLRSVGFPVWLAVGTAALLFGTTHATAEFLPLAEPSWARAAVMTVVGLAWGAALLKWDALTLVIAHCFADLVFFQWPRLASGEASVIWPSVAVLMVPLLPGLVSAVAPRRRPAEPAAV